MKPSTKLPYLSKAVPFTLQIKTILIHANSYDPYENLALEEYLLSKVQDKEIILYLWQNQNTIVIGKNQNPWKECRVSVAQKKGVSIARRLSGGGAVFHDLGNLNFTFIMKEEHYDLDKQLKVIIEAVQNLGINAAFTGKNDITVDGKKFSGNAFYFDGRAAYHHGTILVNTDLTALGGYLQVSQEKMQSKGISSTKSRVTNLIELNPHITIERVSQALVASFGHVYGRVPQLMDCPQPIDLQASIRKNKSWEWLFSQTPKFDLQLEKRFDFGNIELLFLLQDSLIKEVFIYSDAVMVDILDQIQKILIGVRFHMHDINKALQLVSVKNPAQEQMITQIRQWLSTIEF